MDLAAPWSIDPILRRHSNRVCKARTEMVDECICPEFICQLVKPMLMLRKHFLLLGLRNALPMLAHLYHHRLIEGIVADHTCNRQRSPGRPSSSRDFSRALSGESEERKSEGLAKVLETRKTQKMTIVYFPESTGAGFRQLFPCS